MSPRFYLDPNADATAPAEGRVVESEVDLLRIIKTGETGVVRGRDLCQWASEYAKGRGLNMVSLRSPTETARRLCPELTLEQAHELAPRVATRLIAAEPTLPQLAQGLWGEPWWTDEPSAHHAARWLLWWLDHHPTEAETVVLSSLARLFEVQAYGPTAAAYSVRDTDSALGLIRSWLGLGAKLEWGKFPLEFTDKLSTSLRRGFEAQVLLKQGEVLTDLPRDADPRALRLAAEVSAEFYKHQPSKLTRVVLESLRPHLGRLDAERLEALIPPTLPGPLPIEAGHLAKWFLREYLPYRKRVEDGDPTVLEVGRSFGEQFLRMYSRDIPSGGPAREHLSWVKARKLRRPDTVTLLVVLDGLGYQDMEYLWGEIVRLDSSGRISLLKDEVAFTPLPTVTKWAKPALLKGVPPARADGQPDLGKVLARDEDVRRALAETALGELIIWRDQEPDTTYHDKVSKQVALNKARGALTGFAQRLVEAVLEVPQSVPLEVVVTTDHGRLMAASARTYPLPQGTEAHQRAALGDLGLREGLTVSGDIAYLSGSAFSTTEDFAVLLSAESFHTQDGKGGNDAFPHGGVFPEEVLIPWWVLARDIEHKPLQAELGGKGKAGKVGQMTLVVRNPNPIAVEVGRLELLSPPPLAFPVGKVVPPMGEISFQAELAPWPDSAEVERLKARIVYDLPGQRTAQAKVSVKLEAEEMYVQRDNPLEDLL
ncbi:MAG: hypothetical protein IVW51_16105 [Thermaceae bacterium]|nr:hypothetical protein [Thermaceae bacterium]